MLRRFITRKDNTDVFTTKSVIIIIIIFIPTLLGQFTVDYL